MSLKENVGFIKDEISTEEKFFEGFFKLEKVWARYKIAIISVGAVILLSFIGLNVNEYLETKTKIEANQAFNTLLKNPKDTNAINTLKNTNPVLLEAITYISNQQDGKQTKTNVQFLKELSEYNIATTKNNLDEINKLTLNSQFLLKEYAMFQKALIQTSNNNFKDAKETLKLIPDNSPVNQLANMLQHYLLTK